MSYTFSLPVCALPGPHTWQTVYRVRYAAPISSETLWVLVSASARSRAREATAKAFRPHQPHRVGGLQCIVCRKQSIAFRPGRKAVKVGPRNGCTPQSAACHCGKSNSDHGYRMQQEEKVFVEAGLTGLVARGGKWAVAAGNRGSAPRDADKLYSPQVFCLQDTSRKTHRAQKFGIVNRL